MTKSKSLFSFLYNNEVRAFLFQAVALVAIVYFFYSAIDNMFVNIESRGIKTGFGFLEAESGFDQSNKKARLVIFMLTFIVR